MNQIMREAESGVFRRPLTERTQSQDISASAASIPTPLSFLKSPSRESPQLYGCGTLNHRHASLTIAFVSLKSPLAS